MIVGVFGSRNEYPFNPLKAILSRLQPAMVITGDCKGVDQTAYQVCKQLNIPVRVVQCYNNHPNLTYSYDPKDVIETVGDPAIPLPKRLAMRTRRFVEIVKQHHGILLGLHVKGRGSQLAIRVAKQLQVPVYIADFETHKVVRLF